MANANRLRSRLLVGVAAVAVAAPVAGKAVAQDAKWQPWLEAGGQVGTSRSFGDVDMFIPVWQDQTSLLFGDLRGKFSTDPTQEGNFGLGYRTQVDPEWILGGYGYFDIQNSQNDNLFYQATLGIEALSVDWDFRLNGYIPFNSGGQTTNNNNGDLKISGNTIGITHDEEKSLYGFDGEVGWRLPIFPADGDMDVRAFIGGYYFTNSDVDTVAGPRGRLEMRLYDLDFLGVQSRLTVDGEVQWDSPRGTQAFGGLELRIPLGVVTGDAGPKLSPLDRRMVDRVQRDVDIVTRQFQSNPDAVTVDELTVKTHTIVFASADGSPTGKGTKSDPISLDAAVARGESLGKNAIIVVEGDAGSIGVTQPLQLGAGQALLGGDSVVPLHSTKGITENFNVPGSRPTLVGTDSGSSMIRMYSGSQNEIFGLDLTGNMLDGIFGVNMERAIVKQTSIDPPVANGIELVQDGPGAQSSSFVHIEDNTIIGAGVDGILVANDLYDGRAHTQTVIIDHNTANSNGADGIALLNGVRSAGTVLSQAAVIAYNTARGSGAPSLLESGIRVANAAYSGGILRQWAAIAGNSVGGQPSAGILVENRAESAGTIGQSLAILGNSIAGAYSVGIAVGNLASGSGAVLDQSLAIAGNSIAGVGSSFHGDFTGVAVGIAVGTRLYADGSAAQDITIAGNRVSGVGAGDRAYGIRVSSTVYRASGSQAVLISGNQVAGVSAFNIASGIDVGNYLDSAGTALVQSLAILSNGVSDVSAVLSLSPSDTPLLGLRAFGIAVTDNAYEGASLTQALTIAGNGVARIGSGGYAVGIGVGDNLSLAGTVLSQSVAILDNQVSQVSGSLTAFGIVFSEHAYYLPSAAPQLITIGGNRVEGVSAGLAALGVGAILVGTSLEPAIGQELAITGNTVSGVVGGLSAVGILVDNETYQAAISQSLDLSGNSVASVFNDAGSSLGGVGILLFNDASSGSVIQDLAVSANSVAGVGQGAIVLQDLATYGLVAQSGAIAANQAAGIGGTGLVLSAAAAGLGATASVSLGVTGNDFSYDAGGVNAQAAAEPGAAVALDVAFDGNRIDRNAGDGIFLAVSGAGAAASFGLGPSDSVSFNSGFGVELATAGGGLLLFTPDGATITGNSLGNVTGP
jgi:hypothetical protein